MPDSTNYVCVQQCKYTSYFSARKLDNQPVLFSSNPRGTSDLGVGGNKIQNFQNREFLTDFYFLNANIPELC